MPSRSSPNPEIPVEAATALVLLTPTQLVDLVRGAVRAELAAAGLGRDGAELRSVAAAARELGVSDRHVRRMIANRELHPVRLGRRVLIPRGEVQRLTEPAQAGVRRRPRAVHG